MTEAKHTPGPWSVEYGNEAGYDGGFWEWHEVGPAKVEIHRGKDVQALANAHLIAAAPELLEALEGILTFLKNDLPHIPSAMPEINQARAAIAKAKGEEQ